MKGAGPHRNPVMDARPALCDRVDYPAEVVLESGSIRQIRWPGIPTGLAVDSINYGVDGLLEQVVCVLDV